MEREKTAKVENPAANIPHPNILVVGVGGGGCHVLNCLAHFFRPGFDGLAIDTDSQVLTSCFCRNHLLIGERVPSGLSTGGDPIAGRKAAKEHTEEIRTHFEKTDLIFLIHGLGGGTGTGATPVLAELARNMGILVLGFTTLPFDFEGPQRHDQAYHGLNNLRASTDAVITLPNQRIFELISDKTSLCSALRKVDETMASYVVSIWRLLSKTGIINLDCADIRNVVLNSNGTCSLAFAEASGTNKVSSALETILHSPLFDNGKAITKARNILVGITGGSDITLVEIRDIMNGIKSFTHPTAKIVMGSAVENQWFDRIALTVLASESFDDEEKREIIPVVRLSESKQATKQSQRQVESAERRPAQRPIEAAGKGHFKDTEPTIYGGEDLDIPTFTRRGLKLSGSSH